MAAGEPVAIVGMAVLLPGAADLAAYWRNLTGGFDAITEVPADRLDSGFHAADPDDDLPPEVTYCHRGGFLDEPVTVDAGAFGIVPNSIEGMEPDQLIALRVAAAAVADAGGLRGLGDPTRIGVILGRGGYLSPGLMRFGQRVRTVREVTRVLTELVPGLERERLEQVRAALHEQFGPMRPEATIGLVPNLAASRVANRLDLRGPAYTVDAACASSLIAVDQATRELAEGRCDAVLAGGVHHCHDDTLWSVFSQLRALSPSQRIRPLSRAADGLLIGEGTGVVVLKRLADARRDGDRVYAVVRGTGTSSDGRGQSLFNPDAGGQEIALRRAWQAAGLDPAAPHSVGLLEAHGTATRAGDDAELTTLARVFGAPAGSRGVIGSVKSMIGHTMPAAGIAGLVKAALAIHHATLLPTLHCDDPNPLLERTRFRPISAAVPWESAAPRRAAVEAFGFGGINAHVVLEEEPGQQARAPVRTVEPERVLRLAADGPERLRELLDRPDVDLRSTAESEGGCRLGIVDPTAKRLAAARRVLAAGKPWRGRGDIWFSPRPLLREGSAAKVAFVFPGLEAEFNPKCADVAEHFGRVEPGLSTDTVLSRAKSVTEVGLLLDAVLRRIGIRPDALAGHSLGEWTAMTAAGLCADGLLERFGTADFRLPEVDFLALGCSAEEAGARIEAEPDLVVSHDNAPRQSIVCGPPSAIARLATTLRADGIVARPLPFRSGFHTPVMGPLLAYYAGVFDGMRLGVPDTPIWSATTARPYPKSTADLRTLFLEHLVRPVRFRELVERLYVDGFRVFIHIGPGQLGSFIDDTLADRDHLTVSASSGLRQGMAQLRRVAIAFWVEGGRPDFGALDGPVEDGVTVSTTCPPLSVPPSARGLLAGAVEPEVPAGLPGGVAAEFEALLADTRKAARSVLAAAQGGRTLRVSLAEMPYLRAHRFFRQREDWPDETDRRPVVPATTLVEFAMREAERACPGMVAVGVRGARFHRWLTASPAQSVPLGLERLAPDRIAVRVGEFTSMTVELAARYPAPARPPFVIEDPEQEPPLPAAEIYRRREMFHGPEFQGLAEIEALGEWHIRGVLTVLPTPGALLDNVGQLLGCWLMATQHERLLAFPASISSIAVFGPPLPPETRVSCTVRVRTPRPETLEMDAQIVHNGQVWAEINSWQDVRLDCDRNAHRVYAFPRDNLLARRQGDGWWRVVDPWRSVAARELYAGVYLSAPERTEYERVPPRRRGEWLLGRIAVKDAVRSWLAESGAEPAFPAEILVTGDEELSVRGHHGRRLPWLRVSITRGAEPGVVLAKAEQREDVRI
ncbi:beta-ketoacyl synthase N-terminal-like domain-containing protein [Amycolatopsis cihanbeyliensis]|uniref:Acyl transferase domain-containing protein n=1 Tax=Amycolatopsis cihanbeyliensis TaxID=1128664 RepID=A0A542DR19_AMYCI|nr:beta-ketoacyl synthase N-terminal-like domain-containing protein [Amycolatopsis cihanbeyliensis]TQJ05527.1 acyl transferase domain-containing protein [Amycolatopsis cihanbeyliensis]